MNIFSINFVFRAGLAFVFIYAGVSTLLSPADWIGFVPSWVENFGVERELVLRLHAYADLALGLWLLSGVWGALAGFVAFVWLVGITVIGGTPLLLITFRDIGLAIMALGYALYAWKKDYS